MEGQSAVFLTVYMSKVINAYLASGCVLRRIMCQIARLVRSYSQLGVSAAVHAALIDVCRALDHVLQQRDQAQNLVNKQQLLRDPGMAQNTAEGRTSTVSGGKSSLLGLAGNV